MHQGSGEIFRLFVLKPDVTLTIVTRKTAGYARRWKGSWSFGFRASNLLYVCCRSQQRGSPSVMLDHASCRSSLVFSIVSTVERQKECRCSAMETMMLSYSIMQSPPWYSLPVALVRISTKMMFVKGEIVIEQGPDCQKINKPLTDAQHFRLDTPTIERQSNCPSPYCAKRPSMELHQHQQTLGLIKNSSTDKRGAPHMM